MKKILFSIFLSVLVISSLFMSSCSKEQQTLNKLAGDWTYTNVKLLGVDIDLGTLGYTTAKLHFDKCRSITDLCSGVQTLDGTAANFNYNLSDDAKTVNVYNLSGTTNTYIISNVDKNKLVYTTVISGLTYEFYLSR